MRALINIHPPKNSTIHDRSSRLGRAQEIESAIHHALYRLTHIAGHEDHWEDYMAFDDEEVIGQQATVDITDKRGQKIGTIKLFDGRHEMEFPE